MLQGKQIQLHLSTNGNSFSHFENEYDITACVIQHIERGDLTEAICDPTPDNEALCGKIIIE